MTRAVFLDRDGVINRAIVRDGQPFAPATLEGIEILPGVPQALARLRDAGFLLVVVTNQPDVARGRAARDDVEAIHHTMRQTLPIDDVRVCYHDDGDECACRKPKPGLLHAAAIERQIDLSRSYLVGDRWRDIGAGKAAGCATILVDAGHHESTRIEPDVRMSDLSEAAAWILSRANEAV